MQNAAVMEGIHSVDVGILALPPVVELLALVARENDVPYKTGLERPEEPEQQNPSEVDMALAMKSMEEEDKPDMQEEEEKPEEDKPTGLMARREM